LFTGVAFFGVDPEVVGGFDTVPVDVVEPLGAFGSFAVAGFDFGLRLLVLGGVFVFVAGFSLGRDTRNAPRTSSWLSTAIGIAASTRVAQVKRASFNFMQIS